MDNEVNILRRYAASVINVVGYDGHSLELEMKLLNNLSTQIRCEKKKIQYMQLKLFYLKVISFNKEFIWSDID